MILDANKYKRMRIGVTLVGGEGMVENNIRFDAVEDSDLIFLNTFFIHTRFRSRSVSIEDLPPKIRISSDTAGTYKIFVWAE